jgi:hypothetical protein
VWFRFRKQILKALEKIMADAATFQSDLDALKTSVEAIPARVLAAIQAAGPLTQAQLDAADTEMQAIKTEADAVQPTAASAPAAVKS